MSCPLVRCLSSSPFFMFTRQSPPFFFFFFNDTATTEIYTLSLHDALPIFVGITIASMIPSELDRICRSAAANSVDRKSTRLNSSHLGISYAVFCLKKKKNYEGHLVCT